MKFSENWLREFVNLDIDTAKLTEQLTMAGLEVDAVTPVTPQFKDLVVVQIESVKQHPNAEYLSICDVVAGSKKRFSIVCGANNIVAGMHTVLAQTGAILSDKQSIKTIELEGIRSDGMLCSAKQIGIGDDHSGIIELPNTIPVGKHLDALLQLPDKLIEVSLTPNRGDCLSLHGMAREVAAINRMTINQQPFDPVCVTTKTRRDVVVSAKKACPRYLGRVIENIDMRSLKPLWMTEKLRRSGIRSINIVADITNFVMLELGQPMHAFDNEKIQGSVRVREPKPNEKIRLLDGSLHTLQSETLLIADDRDALAMAGLMGGIDSAVQESTQHVFLESAYFHPEVIIGQARQYGLHTDSSHRFERGVDPELQRMAIERATQLILDLCGGAAGPVVEVRHDQFLPKNHPISLRKSQIKRILGIDLEDHFIRSTLQYLNMTCDFSGDTWTVTPPSFRSDIQIEVDLIEELARVYGYNQIPATLPQYKLNIRSTNRKQAVIRQAQEMLVNRGYREVMTYSFVDPLWNQSLMGKKNNMVLVNPINAQATEMRTNLWPGLLSVLQYNIKRQHDRMRLFEIGLVFNGNESLSQDVHLGGLVFGNTNKKQWNLKEIISDFYHIKADVEAIISILLRGVDYEFVPMELDILHPAQTMRIMIDGRCKGYFGQLHPKIAARLASIKPIFLFEIDIEGMIGNDAIKYQSISRFPSIRRDLAIVVNENTPYAHIKKCIENNGTTLLINLELFDVYQGKGIEKGKKSLALGLTFRATSSTLKDAEVEMILEKIVSTLQYQFSAELRK